MTDRHDDDRFGELLGETIARRATSVSARPDEEALFARVGARAGRQRRVVAAAAVVAIAVASFVGYSIGSTNREGDSIVQTPPAGTSDPATGASPSPEDGPMEHLFTRTTPAGITVRVYSAPAADPALSPGFIVAEMTNDAAVGVARAENCYGGGILASGTFGGPEGSPVEWVIVSGYDLPSTAGQPVRANFSGTTDEMIPEPGAGGIAVLVAPGAGGEALVEGPGGGGLVTIGQPVESTCPPQQTPPPPATLPPAGPQPADPAAAEAEVRQAYADVYENYDPAHPDVGDTAINERVRQALREAGFTDEQLAAMSVEVGEVRFTDEAHAAVLFRVTVPEHDSNGWQLGYAELRDGQWAMAAETQCEHLRNINVPCP
jgi:hypothetical protein